jgi:integrase
MRGYLLCALEEQGGFLLVQYVVSCNSAKRLLQAAQGDLLEGIITVTLALGLRRGEALGLKWEDIDLKNKCLYIQRSAGRVGTLGIKEKDPKTNSSKRKIDLPDFVVEALKSHQKRQLESKERLAEKWTDSGYVFTNKYGRFLQESHLYNSYKALLKRAGLPDIRFHDLRHSAATIMLSMGVNPKVIQEVLGHSNIRMTLGIYAHVLPSMQQEMTQKLDDLFNKNP